MKSYLILVSNDQAFRNIEGLIIENWMEVAQ